jgi:radical SAM protein with 4Fe4S-binding SPASM domain
MSKAYEIIESKLGASIKDYRDKWDMAGKNNYIPDYPLHLNFELTYGCNLKCEFCICSLPVEEWPYKVSPSKSISFDKYCEIIDEACCSGLYSIELNGINEPLLKKDIDRYIRYAKDKGVLIVSLHSNAFVLTNEISKKIINSGLDLIIFSVDAIKKQTYNSIRKGGDFDRVMYNIHEFLNIKKEKDFPLVQMSFSKNKFNYNELDEYISYWEDKVDIVSESSFCNPFIGTKREKEIEDKYRLESVSMNNCYEPFQRLFIRQDGKVHPCCSFFGGEYIVGDIYDDSIREIWNNLKIKEFRKKVFEENDKNFICNKCRKSMSAGG